MIDSCLQNLPIITIHNEKECDPDNNNNNKEGETMKNHEKKNDDNNRDNNNKDNYINKNEDNINNNYDVMRDFAKRLVLFCSKLVSVAMNTFGGACYDDGSYVI